MRARVIERAARYASFSSVRRHGCVERDGRGACRVQSRAAKCVRTPTPSHDGIRCGAATPAKSEVRRCQQDCRHDTRRQRWTPSRHCRRRARQQQLYLAQAHRCCTKRSTWATSCAVGVRVSASGANGGTGAMVATETAPFCSHDRRRQYLHDALAMKLADAKRRPPCEWAEPSASRGRNDLVDRTRRQERLRRHRRRPDQW